ncbi:MAG: ATP-binding protein [Candidatus Saganbacteria bacterium]|nr:ATP-binding protein [Candidatus Saganbacteria bacterium]
MIQVSRTTLNNLPGQSRAKQGLAALIREQLAQKGLGWFVCSPNRGLPATLSGLGGIEIATSEICDGSFQGVCLIRELANKIIEVFYAANRDRIAQLTDNLALALGELLKNAAIHGNDRKPKKKVMVLFRQAGQGFIINVLDEGRRPLFLLSRSWETHELAAWFRLNYSGQNCGLLSIEQGFGPQNLSASKIYDASGRRLGTSISLLVKVLRP